MYSLWFSWLGPVCTWCISSTDTTGNLSMSTVSASLHSHLLKTKPPTASFCLWVALWFFMAQTTSLPFTGLDLKKYRDFRELVELFHHVTQSFVLSFWLRIWKLFPHLFFHFRHKMSSSKEDSMAILTSHSSISQRRVFFAICLRKASQTTPKPLICGCYDFIHTVHFLSYSEFDVNKE
jgi:hypothetical protein